ncbi:Protein-arginine kinase [Pontiella desulfatans]|uniref:Protein-arginine kinase n=1 Tax=Pontiella desulfatans TaxID=2750659 RepID=A0A6C2TYX3_PONDE|nr:protein arginine kinase [Pontiella desulfatans]VGO12852.1 Protein-arginine kinase [Pontiella desulfatans]
MTLDDMVRRHGSWLEAGIDEGPVISSRVRLARNLEQYSFPGWASEEENHAVWKQAAEIFNSQDTPYIGWSMTDTPALDKEILFERHLISQELAQQDDSCGVFVTSDECLAVMVNEEDHIRIQSLQPGLNLQGAWKAADQTDDKLEEQLTYAFSPRLGYLTSCPSNVGTGMRASVMLHLPGLVLMEEMDPVINGISKIGLAVRGMWGEGTEAAGNMFQVSNQITLGRREDEIIAHLEQIVLELIEHENNARIRLMNDKSLMIEDHVARAFGILSNARLISSGEALNLLSTLRLGVDQGMLKQLSRRELDMLFISIQPAHLQKLEGKALAPEERDVVRAGMLRDYMDNVTEDGDLD